MSAVGSTVHRRDAGRKASGRANYTQDISVAGMLYGAVVRSSYAAARIRAIDKTPAWTVPGVLAVLDASDLPETRFGLIVQEETLLARGVVRYVGEPVALVAAETKEAAQLAADLVSIGYVPTPAVVNLEAALRPDAPAVHEGKANVMEPSVIQRGDPAHAFAAADLVITTTVRSQRVHQGYIEPRAALAQLTERGLEITTSSQAPFSVRTSVAALLDLLPSDIVVRAPTVGGGFGGKLQPGIAPQAAALAIATGRPVQIVCSREEELQAANPRENSLITLESAVAHDGKILARRAVIYVDAGAYAAETPAVASVTALQSTGPYAIDNVHAKAHAVYTNTASTGAMRGPGAPQLMYATEAHMNEIAAQLGITPVQLRRRNMFRDGAVGPTGQRIDEPALEACLDAVEGRLDEWRANPTAVTDPTYRRGIGLALGWWSTGIAAGSAATVALADDGIATIYTGATEIGTGAVVSGIALLAADELGLDFAQIRLVSGSTNEPYDVGSEGSRTMYGAGVAVQRAAAEVSAILAQAVGDHLEADAADIVLREGRAMVAGSPERSVDIVEAVRLASAGGPVIGTGRFFAPTAEHDPSCLTGMFLGSNNEPTFHCHGVEIHVSEETGDVRIPRYIVAHDIGRAVNPVGIRVQIEGGVVQGIGYALYEEVQTTADGYTLNDNLADYRMPTAADIPGLLEIYVIEDHEAFAGPKGAKGVGEAPALLPAAALGSAIRDALGAQPLELPMSGPRILDCIDSLSRQNPRGYRQLLS